jgi:uncharacterized protein (TIGR03435 family)
VIYTSEVRTIITLALATLAYSQTSAKPEFEVASIKVNAPQTGFHFAADSASGGPGTADPGMFRCTGCSLATLIVKAFNLQPYQFPGRITLSANTYDIQARIPDGATQADFLAMLQNLLKDRFGLTWHFQEKMMKGYHLVVAKNGAKLKESTAPQHSGPTESHKHSGVIAFGTSANFRAANQTTADLARVLSDQIGLPVDDETGIAGKYDISLRWSPTNAAAHAGDHSEGGGHGYHEGGAAPPGDTSGPTLFDALQQQLGLRLVPAEQAQARLFIVDRVSDHPTEN